MSNDFSTLAPPQLQLLRLQTLAARDQLDQAEDDLRQRLAALDQMRAQLEDSLKDLDLALLRADPAGADVEKIVRSRADADPAFRRRLLSHPMEAIVDLGVRLPEGVTVRVLQDTPTERHYVLPAAASVTPRLRTFLTTLAADPARQAAFIENPEAVMQQESLSADDKKVVRTGNFADLYATLGREVPEALNERAMQLQRPGKAKGRRG